MRKNLINFTGGLAMPTDTVLVVDDDPMIREVVAQALEFEGYTVESAANGLEALAAIEQERPAVVLLDMRMPVLDGWGFARELRARGHDVPIVVMTATQDPERWAEQIEAQACLAKPFDLTALTNTVERFMSPSGPPTSESDDTYRSRAA